LVDILEKLLLDFFQNPFNALANGNFLAIIVFAILFGISIRQTVAMRMTRMSHPASAPERS